MPDREEARLMLAVAERDVVALGGMHDAALFAEESEFHQHVATLLERADSE